MSSLTVATVVLLAAATSASASSDATVVRTTISASPGLSSGSATCPAGEDATGGGVALNGGSASTNDEFVSDSGPVDASGFFSETTTGTVPVEWYGTSDITTSGSNAYVWVVCSHTSTTVVRTSIGGSGAIGFHSGFARCPSGQDATGGGLGVRGGSVADSYEFLSDDGPLNSGGTFDGTTTGAVPTEWYGTAYFETAGATAYVWAVCG